MPIRLHRFPHFKIRGQPLGSGFWTSNNVKLEFQNKKDIYFLLSIGWATPHIMTHFQPKFICVRQKQFFFVNENATTKNTLFQKCHIDAYSTKEKYVSWLNPMFYYGNKNVIILGPHILKKKRNTIHLNIVFVFLAKVL